MFVARAVAIEHQVEPLGHASRRRSFPRVTLSSPASVFVLLAVAWVGGCSSSPGTAGSAASGGSESASSGSAGSGETGSTSGGAGGSAGASSGANSGATSGAGAASGTNAGPSAGSASGGSRGAAGAASGTSSGAGSSGSATGGASGSIVSDAGRDAAPEAAAPVAHTGVWRITPLGDSITEDTCGPQLLSQELISNGHTNFVFVGTETNDQSCSNAPDVQTEGHGGYLVTDLLPAPHVATMQDHSAELPMWATNDKPDVILMQFGTNDVWNGIATQTILSAYSLVLADFRAVSPNVILFVAQITPLNPSGCTTCEQQAETLNAAIPGWATSESTAASPVYVVDVWSAFTASTYLPNSMYTSDGVHPNPAGSALVAQKWYDALLSQKIP
jgi:lysophospholipase L1-like esterase